ncbi:MAG TPA: transporter substrate-binding domain-containing protein [Rhodocyclaceae bacterium]|nr:transporter substrate-binding domain-containing protein [Rhodocyclaceae bacterium]
MMKRLRMLAILLMMLPLSIAGYGEALAISVYAIYIPKLLGNDGSGPFADLIHEIGRRAGLNIEIIVLPPQRQRVAFGKKQIDIIFPMVESSFDAETEYLRSSSFFDKKYFAFTKRGQPCVRSMADLTKLSGPVGLTLGYSYPHALLTERRLVFDYAPTDDQNMSKIGVGRIAAFVVEEVSGLAARNHTKLDAAIQYDPQSPLFTEGVFFAFQKKESLVPIRDAISRAIDEMKTDGSLRKILGNLQPSGKGSSPRGGRPECQ